MIVHGVARWGSDAFVASSGLSINNIPLDNFHNKQRTHAYPEDYYTSGVEIWV